MTNTKTQPDTVTDHPHTVGSSEQLGLPTTLKDGCHMYIHDHVHRT